MKTSNKIVLRESEVREKAFKAIEKASLPVIETIGPRGKNVMYQDAMGNPVSSNDGVTIINNINFEDQLEDLVVQLIKDGARRTNQIAGDATSTTVLYTYNLIKKAYELKRKGYSQRKIRDILNTVAEKMLKRLESQKKVVKDSKVEFDVAKISANNDPEIAKTTVEVIKTTGLDGMIFIDINSGEETVLEKQTGFRVPNGMVYQNLYNDPARPVAQYKNLPTIIFDKRLYYAEECEHILRVALDSGFKELVIVAKDFIGDAPNTFIANHAQGVIKLVLVKCDNDIQMEDLAVYLGAETVSEAAGRRVDSIGSEDFTMVESVFADPTKVLIQNTGDNKKLKDRISGIKEELKKTPDEQTLKDRLASLTNGIVTIKVGARTQSEAREKIFRFEDAISAVRAAKQHGFLIGGGIAMYNAYNPKDYSNRDEDDFARILSRSSIEQIAENSMLELDYDKIKGDVGLNAMNGKHEDLYKAGVIEPFKAVEMAIKNAVSVADIITSIGTYIINDIKEDKEN